MKKGSSSQQSPERVAKASRVQRSMTIGMDLGDKHSCYCVLDGQGELIQEGSVGTTKKAMAKVFGSMGCCRIAIEVGTHSPWVSRLLRGLGHETVIANPRQKNWNTSLLEVYTVKHCNRCSNCLPPTLRLQKFLSRQKNDAMTSDRLDRSVPTRHGKVNK